MNNYIYLHSLFVIEQEWNNKIIHIGASGRNFLERLILTQRDVILVIFVILT